METIKMSAYGYKKTLEAAAKAIKEGKVLVCPTDTVYGLVCDSSNKKAMEKIYRIKKRPKTKLLPVFVKDVRMAKKLVKINKDQSDFLNKAWPGAVTAVVEKKKGALRVPKYRFVIDLISKSGRALAETSANISGLPSSNNIKEIMSQFSGNKCQPDLTIDAGNLPKARPSAVVDLTVFPPKILRT